MEERNWALAGKVLMPRDIAAKNYKLTNWRNYELTKSIAVSLGESTGTLGAWHDNEDDAGNVVSRDCGLYQINIPAHDIGSPIEDALRTESLDPAVYEPVWENNVDAAVALYNQPWQRDGKQTIRRWQPWVAYTSGWATFPEFWVWSQTRKEWEPTGRYIIKAIAGQMNFHVVIWKDWTPEAALFRAKQYGAEFGVADHWYIRPKDQIISWHVPAAPTKPPADGVGPRPVPNNGV